MSDAVPAFGARLRSCRQSAGLSQQELAERAGLSVRALSDLERGRTRFPYQDSVARLAGALGLREQARTEFVTAAGRRLGRPEAGIAPRQAQPADPAVADPAAGRPAAIEDLARAQHAQPVHDPAELGDDIWESGAELEAFLADLRAARTLTPG